MKWLQSLLRESTENLSPNEGPQELPFVNTQSGPVMENSSPETGTFPQSAAAVQASAVPTEDLVGNPSSVVSEDDDDTAVMSPPRDAAQLLFSRLDELVSDQRQVADRQRQLNELFATRLRSDEAQAKAVEKLHDELRQYRSNFVRQQTLPLLKEVIYCHDFLSNELRRAQDAGGDAGTGSVRALDVARQMLLDLLFKYDVEPYRNEDEPFDPKSQQCSQTLPTDRAELDKQIAGRGLEGFRGPDGIVRREQVSVYRFQPAAPSPQAES